MQKEENYNVILVDAKRLVAGPWYLTALQNTLPIGRYTARLIEYLVSKGVNLSNIHLIGHSLGAHMAGNTGSSLKIGKIRRITGKFLIVTL